MQLVISTWEKSYEDIYHCPPHVSVIRRIILITIIRFALSYLLLASNSTFITDSMYLGTIQISQNLNEHYYCLISTASVIWQIDANCSPNQARTFKTIYHGNIMNLLSLKSHFSKYYFKSCTICHLFLSSHVFTALELDSNHFSILL